ncbi:MAG: hypothetical protein HYU66_22380, partial [Armatimonadetes bacterium]|nr:hypothetical protein [Armatimonadota bacterium]
PDGVRADGSTWRMVAESDVEYLAVLALWRTWLISGDDQWLAEWLRASERALQHLRESPLRWDAEQGLVRRAHTCDTWDFSIYDGDRYDASTPAVAALCDQTGYHQALLALAQIYEHLGRRNEAMECREEAKRFRLRAVHLLWDGEKLQHHHHLDAFDHGTFDETRQLAMSNPWAILRGLVEVPQAQRILHTYRRRWEETGDRFPWWSLQPGYPHADYPFLRNHKYQHTGGYCNGGLMPWVGGALSHAAFVAGEAVFGAELLRDYAQFLVEQGGEIYTWYWPDMQPGFRTANTTGHDGWGMGHWLAALFEGLAGVESTGPAMRTVTLSPRWTAAGIDDVSCTVHLPSSEAYLAYRWTARPDGVVIELTGVAERIELRVLCPEARRAERVTVGGREAEWADELVGVDRYARVGVEGVGVRRVGVTWGE